MADGFPCARRDDLLVQEVLDELLIYDLRSHEAHFLSAAAAAIWRGCDGTHARRARRHRARFPARPRRGLRLFRLG